MTEIEALRTCLQGLLQERNVVVYCPNIVYDSIRNGFGGWQELVSNQQIAEAAALLKNLHNMRKPMAVNVRFENYQTEETHIVGPLDWVEVESGRMTAEADDGDTRHEELAVYNQCDFRWYTEDSKGWDYYVVYATKE